MSPGSISVVLNKAEDDTGLDAVEMVGQLGRRFEAMVPYSRDVPLSVNVGVPLIAGKPKSQIANLLSSALSAVLPGHRREEPVVAPAPVAPKAIPTVVLPEPAPVGVDKPVPDEGQVEEEPVEIDLTETPAMPCPATVRARPGSRCRRFAEQSATRSGRSRSPPHNRIRPTRPRH
jgi:hypothetical protein